MGNNQGGLHKRERVLDGQQRTRQWTGGSVAGGSGASGHMMSGGGTTEDGCPVQVKIAKSDGSVSTPSIQFSEANEYPVVFKWQGGSQAGGVYISGSWDGWKKMTPLCKSTQDFSTIINLNPVDENAAKIDNKFGSQNNVIAIDEADFEVFDALDRDLASSNAGEAMRKVNMSGAPPSSHDTPNEREIEKLKNFTQEIPDRREFEKAQNPPVLPPHLLQVILNKDTPMQCDPNVLPEPNHVMLNHLYALSIKDGVMVLSATHRYRKKYVTTLLYKPI
ncbi:5'-AMP-activated protein kinase [Loa loa]|uniref:5'-AMP-activated protein kinase subunit beta-1 n=1 Tax=Loa loa TaxID=7209 RepID=A0A1S0U015_LOALO|nr:5'-AMP-activated protein kinase [Loa loa]EFO22217.1 5'-AMP-activated protein kinase [Loa loa]